MPNIESVNKLLENGIITKDEYEVIIERLRQERHKTKFTWETMITGFYDWCMENYSLITAKGYKTCMYKFMLYLTKKDNNKDAFKEAFETYSFTDVNNFINKMITENFSKQAINKTKYAIAVFGNYLSTLELEAPDINNIKISITGETHNVKTVLHEDDVLKIAEIGELRNKVCILLCYEGCLKRMELCEIKVQDFDFDKNQLVIYKDGKLERVCVLSEYTISTVKTYIKNLYKDIESWNNARAKSGRPIREDFGYIFQSIKMVKPSYSILQTMLKTNVLAYYESMGQSATEASESSKNITFETIRNSRKVYLLSKGYSVNDVMHLCGDNNYMSTHRFSKFVGLLYPESVM